MKIDPATAGFITSWIGLMGVIVCILMGHDGTLVDVLAGINIVSLGGIGLKSVTSKGKAKSKSD